MSDLETAIGMQELAGADSSASDNPVDRLNRLIDLAFSPTQRPRLGDVVHVDAGGIRLVLAPDETHLRYGDIVSGPSIMALADVAAYAALLARLGARLEIVTSSFNIDFIRKCPLSNIAADAALHHLGRQRALVSVKLSDQASKLVIAMATVTYAIAGP